RQIQNDSRIPRAPSGNEPRRVQDHLLVGVDASATGTARRGRISPSFAVVSLAWLDRAVVAPALMDHFRARCRARSCWLVDGRLRPFRTGARVTILSGGPFEGPR